MKLVIHKADEKIRMVVICFAMFTGLMLFQTPYKNLGTISAGTTLFMTLATAFLHRRGLRRQLTVNKGNVYLATFLVYSILLTMIKGFSVSGLVKYIGQIVLCLLLFSVKMNQREQRYMNNVFLSSSTVYAILIIWSYLENTRAGYYHTNVILFNTAIDPNFICIPMVASSPLLLDNILHRRRLSVSLIVYIINVTATIYTASRGGCVALACSNMLVLTFFLFSREISTKRKIMYMFLQGVLLISLISAFRLWFPLEWERITSFGISDGSSRFRLWQTALEDWRESPFFGNGLGNAFYIHSKATHNTYLQVLSETGLVGFCLMIGFTGYMLMKAFRYDIAMFSMLIGMLIQLFFLNGLDNRCVWVILCWIAMLPNCKRIGDAI